MNNPEAEIKLQLRPRITETVSIEIPNDFLLFPHDLANLCQEPNA